MNRLLIAICLLLLAPAVVAKQSVLTEEMAIQMGLSHDFVQMRADGLYGQAQSDVIAAKTRPNPNFIYDRETLKDAGHVEQKFVVTQKFDFSGRRNLNIQAADRHLEAAQLESEAWRIEFLRDIRAQYFITLHQQKRQEAFSGMQKRINLLVKALNKRKQQGDVSIYDFQRVNTERAAIEAEATNASVEFQASLIRLHSLLGEEAGKYNVLRAELLPDQTESLDVLRVSLENQPNIQYLREQSEGFALQQQAENRTFPNITLGVGVKREEIRDQSDNGLVLFAAVPIQVFDKRKDKQKKSEAQTLISNSEYQIAYLNAQAELSGLWQQNQQYQISATKFRKDAVLGAYDLIKIAEAYYRAGEVGILELLDAYRGALDAELTALDLEYKSRDARIKLDYLTGGPFYE